MHAFLSRLRINSLARFVFFLILVALPLGLGGNVGWCWGTACVALAVLFTVRLIQFSFSKRCAYARGRHPLSGLIIAGFLFFLLMTIVQTVSLPHGIVHLLSPNTAALWTEQEHALGVEQPEAWQTLSLLPSQTGQACLMVVLALLCYACGRFFFKTRRQVLLLALMLVVSAVVAALAAVYLRQTTEVWGLSRPVGQTGLSGTFLNRNHFAMLMAMALPLMIGMTIGFLKKGFCDSFENPDVGFYDVVAHPAVTYITNHLATIYATVFCGTRALGLSLWMFVMWCGGLFLVAVALMGSLSRAGFACGVLSCGLLLAVALVRQNEGTLVDVGYRRNIPLRVGGVAVFIAGVLFLGSGFLTAMQLRWDDAIRGDASSWVTRIDAWKAGLSLVREHPLTGVGLGATKFVSVRFEAGMIPDRLAYYVHNDWLQLIDEMGVPVALLLLSVLIYVFVRLIRVLWNTADPLIRWTGFGALAGLLAVMLHSVVEYGLRYPANAAFASVLLAIAVSCAGFCGGKQLGRRQWLQWPVLLFLKIRTRGVAWAEQANGRLVLVGVAVAFVVVVACQAYPYAKASDAKILLLQAARKSAESPGKELRSQALYCYRLADEVSALMPDDPEILAQKAIHAGTLTYNDLLDTVGKMVAKKYSKNGHTPHDVSHEILLSAAVAKLWPKWLQQLPAEEREAFRKRFDASAQGIKRACRMMPGYSLMLVEYIRAVERYGWFTGDFDTNAIEAAAKQALRDAPHQGETLLTIAEQLVLSRIHAQTLDESAKAELMRVLTEAVRCSPLQASRAYAAAWGMKNDEDLILQMAGSHIVALDKAYHFFYSMRLLDACKRTSEDIFNNLGWYAKPPVAWRVSDPFSYFRRSKKTFDWWSLELCRREIILAGLMEQWPERSKAVDEYRAMQDRQAQDDIEQAQVYRQNGDFRMSLRSATAALQKAPDSFGSRLAFAKVRSENNDLRLSLVLLLPLIESFESWSDADASAVSELAESIPEGIKTNSFLSDQEVYDQLDFGSTLLKAVCRLRWGLTHSASTLASVTETDNGLSLEAPRRFVDPDSAILFADNENEGYKDVCALLAGRVDELQHATHWPWRAWSFYVLAQATARMGNTADAVRYCSLALQACPTHLATLRLFSALQMNPDAAPAFAQMPESDVRRLEDGLALLDRLDSAIPLTGQVRPCLQIRGVSISPRRIKEAQQVRISIFVQASDVYRLADGGGSRPVLMFERAGRPVMHLVLPALTPYDWRPGELVELKATIVPSVAAARSPSGKLQPGWYDLRLDFDPQNQNTIPVVLAGFWSQAGAK